MAQSERPPGADEVQLVLERAAPGEVEKGELVEEVALSTDELREAIEWLMANGQVEDTDEGYRYIGEGSGQTEEPSAPAAEDEQPDDDEVAGPALSAHVRAGYVVACSFPRLPDEEDERSLAKAQKIAADLGNVLSRALPHLDFHVEVSNVEVFDRARPLWPPPREQ